MIPTPIITDHALLRYMERVHGIDIDTWRHIMRLELQQALDAYDGRDRPGEAMFVLSPTGEKVVSFLGAGQHPSPKYPRTTALPRVAS